MNLLFEINKNADLNIPGLSYTPDYITADEQDALISQIDQESWLNDLKRRIQHYGYKYDYKARTVGNDAYLGALPQWQVSLVQKLWLDKIFGAAPDQVIINEYMPGQGISAHTDCVPCFDDTIASLSLGSPCIIQFSNPRTGEKQEVFLEERSLIILSGEARYEWQHGIPARKSDIVDGFKIERGRRISLTFRNVILSQK